MAIREDLVASAAQFLQDPNVASSPVENRIAFLQAKNLTQEEVSAAMARASSDSGAPPSYPPAPPATYSRGQQQPYYGQYPPYAWQPPPQEPPRRDWRDWFIVATVAGGVSYGLYALTKRYIYPLVAPPTPERLEQDKKSIDEQFERAFGLVEQLAKDTEALKAAEKDRTERLDAALADLESTLSELKAANRRREDDANRVRDDVQNLKSSLPRAMDSQKEQTDNRMKELNTELKSLKTLISQRMTPAAPSSSTPAPASGYLRASGAVPPAASPDTSATPVTPVNGTESSEPASATQEDSSKPRDYTGYVASLGRSSPFSSGMPISRASIPDWQKPKAPQAASVSTPEAEGSSAQVSGSN